jgi:hypothetical protein
MTQDEIDTMWQKAMRQSIKEGEMFTRYQFAHLVAAKATEEANARANASWTLMCKKMVAFEREALAQHDSVQVQPEPEQEPVKYSDYEPDGVHHNKPPQRKPLTDEQIEQLEQDTCAMEFPETVRAIEAAHGIKE